MQRPGCGCRCRSWVGHASASCCIQKATTTTPSQQSASPVLLAVQAVAVAFPDEGAKKRFGGFFEKAGYPAGALLAHAVSREIKSAQIPLRPSRSSSAAKSAKERRESFELQKVTRKESTSSSWMTSATQALSGCFLQFDCAHQHVKQVHHAKQKQENPALFSIHPKPRNVPITLDWSHSFPRSLLELCRGACHLAR